MENHEEADTFADLVAALPRIDRYKVVRGLGEGAYGVVVLAQDLELQRQVAIKFVHPERRRTPELLEEARTLAALEHPGLCRVFDVGLAGGRTFLAMQYLEGPTLQEAAADLKAGEGIPGILHVMVAITEAVWFAHARGIAHRDLKASNVILTTDPHGAFQPVILDFGLAAPVEGAESAVPSDLWSLGEMLYVLLGGKPSHSGPSSLLRIGDTRPRPSLQSLGIQVSADLEAVLEKALSLRAEQRYDSAKALGEDLRCLLEKRPTGARPLGTLGRTGLFVRRHPWATGWSMVALLALGAVTGTFIHQRRLATQRLLYTQRFTREAEQMESLLYRAFAMPVGDSARVLSAVRTRMASLTEEGSRLPIEGQGPLEYALGRVDLSLAGPYQAKLHLDRAALYGFKGPEEDYARGMAYALVFLNEMRGVDGKAREARRLRLEKEFPGLQAQAQQWLKAGHQLPLGTPDLGAALLAATEDRWEEALKLARAAQAAHPYAWEPLLFEGSIHRDRATKLLNEGAWDRLDAELAEWETGIRKAEALGRSCPSVALERFMMEVLRNHAATLRGDFSEARLQRMRAIGDAVLALDPGEWRALVSLADLEDEFGGILRAKDRDPRAHHREAVAFAERACAVRPEENRCWATLGDVLDSLARAVQTPDPEKILLWERSLKAYQRAVELRPQSLANLNNLANTCNQLGDFLLNRGGPALDPLKRGEEALRKALTLEPLPLLESNLASNLALQAQYSALHGDDATRSFAEASSLLEESRRRYPNHPNLYWAGGTLYRLEAKWRLLGHGDPLPALEKSRQLFLLGLAQMPQNCEFASQPLLLRAQECEHRLRRGLESRQAIHALEIEWRTYQARGDCGEWRNTVRVGLATVRLLELRARGTWDESEWTAGKKALEAWEKFTPNDTDLHLARARLAHAASGCTIPASRRTTLISEQEAAIQKALVLNPTLKEETDFLRKE